MPLPRREMIGIDFGQASDKALRAGESNPIPLVGRTVKDFDTGRCHHLHQLYLPVAFVVVIAEHTDGRNTRADYHIEQRFHFIGLAIVGQVSGENENVRLIAHVAQLIVQHVLPRWREM